MTKEQFDGMFKPGDAVIVNGFLTKLLSPQSNGLCEVFDLDGKRVQVGFDEVHVCPIVKGLDVYNRADFEKYLLSPVLKELSVADKYLRKFKLQGYDMVGVIVAEIRQLKRMLENQKKTILGLKKKRQGDAQVVMDFVRCCAARK